MSSRSTKPEDGEGGRLWVVATPIGNLEDITLRALRVLREADAIVAEDTRHTRRLCAAHDIGTRLLSFHAHSGDEVVERLADELARGARYALVTDAGTPLVSDPGGRLVAAAAARDVPVLAIPGPSAALAALTVSAIPWESFRFAGFLPRSGGRRSRALGRLAEDPSATILFESPHRVGDTLRDLAEVLGDSRRIAVCRELTKLHEEVARGTAGELAARFADGARGEITLVVEGAPVAASPEVPEGDARARARALLDEGLSARDAARRLAEETGLKKRDAYQIVLETETAGA